MSSPPTPKRSRLDTAHKRSQAYSNSILKCAICLSKVNDPCLCPQCSKMYCRHCILEWLSPGDRSCPNCKFPMTDRQLVKLRWIGEIEKLEQNLQNSYSNMDTRKGYPCDGSYGKGCCKEHHLPLKFFCVECNECICETCVTNGAHGPHTFKAVKVVSDQVLKEIEGELGKVENYREQLEKVTKRIDQNISLFDRVLNEKLGEVQDIVNCMTEYLIKQHTVQVQQLQEEKKKVTQAIVILDQKVESVKHDLEQRTKQQMISLQPSIMQSCSEIMEQPLPDFNSIRLPARLMMYMPYTCETGVFVVRNFSALQNQEEYSMNIDDNEGRTWRIWASSDTSTDQFELYLAMVKGSMCWTKCNFKLLNRDPEKTISKTFRKSYSPNTGDWGWQNFATISAIKEEGYLHNDELEVLYNIRRCLTSPTEDENSFNEMNGA